MPQLLSMFKFAKQEQAEMSLPQITDQLALEDVAYLVRYHVDREMLAQDSPDELDEERNLDSVPQKLTSSSRSKAKDGLTKQKLKVLKRQTKELKRINVDLVRQLKEASDLFQDQLNEGSTELKCEKMTQLLRQVCESNYYML
jgi:AAA+ ATPase superfamily predicted ATPase